MNDTVVDATREDLDELANAMGQPNQPRGNAVARLTAGIPETVIGAQAVAVYRDERKILEKLRTLAAAAGSDWFYRFPVRKKEGGQDWIEGPSIKLANEVHRVFGNLQLQIREIDVGDAWVFYARETDLEGGSSTERAYRQRKSQGSMKTKDAERQLDIAYQIGQSKAIRNVICNFLQLYCDFAFEEARASIVQKIGKDLPAWRDRTVQGIANMKVDLARVERVVGRPAKDWLAPNVAAVVSMMQSVADGMATADEVFPPIEPANVPSTSNAAAGREGGGVQDTGTPATSPAHEPGVPAAADPISVAYERGKAHMREAGAKRTDVPEEYKQHGHIRECDAWLAGFDGKPMPGKLV